MSQNDTARPAQPAPMFIAGKWAQSDTIRDSINPSTGLVVGTYYDGGEAQAREAADAAAEAFADTGWSRHQELRADALEELADAIRARIPDLAAMLSKENGKLLYETTWEATAAASSIRYAAAAARTQVAGRSAEVDPGHHFSSRPEPVGVVAIISPWNSPLYLSARALGPALAAGCTVVIKMPGQTALTNAIFAEVLASVDSIPSGVVNIVTELGGKSARHLVASPQVNFVSYTGSTAVGRQIAASAAAAPKRVGLELGGKTPLLIFPDADLDLVIPTVVQAGTMMNGQFCCTGSRVLVHRDIADQVRTALTQALSQVQLGAWDDPAARLGPLIDSASAQRVDALVEEAATYGQVLLRGGVITDGPLASSGAFYRPSLVEVADPTARIVQEEVFGPVQTFEVFDDEADAIRLANATEYGLAASIFTSDLNKGRRVGRAIKAGGIWINTWGGLSDHFETTGFQNSGYGYLTGPQAIEQFQMLKVYVEVDQTLART